MYWQQRYLEEAREFPSVSGLETIDLPEKGLLGGLELKVYAKPGATGDYPDFWIHDALQKIELIVNGSKVVKSLEGNQLLAHMMYQHIPIFSHDVKNQIAVSGEEFFYINLGLKYHDLDYLLDLGQVSDPELRITYNFSQTTINGWTHGQAFATTPKPAYSLIPHILREPTVAPKGYIKTSEIYRFTSAAGKKHNMHVPRGPVYANLYLQSRYNGEGLTLNLDKVELNINSDDVIPYRVGLSELLAENARLYGQMVYDEKITVLGGQVYPFPLEVGQAYARLAYGIGLFVGIDDIWANSDAFTFWTATATEDTTNDYLVFVTYKGGLPFSVAAIPYFEPLKDWTWIDSSKLGDLWLRVEEVAGAGTHAVIKLLADEVVTSYPAS